MYREYLAAPQNLCVKRGPNKKRGPQCLGSGDRGRDWRLPPSCWRSMRRRVPVTSELFMPASARPRARRSDGSNSAPKTPANAAAAQQAAENALAQANQQVTQQIAQAQQKPPDAAALAAAASSLQQAQNAGAGALGNIWQKVESAPHDRRPLHVSRRGIFERRGVVAAVLKMQMDYSGSPKMRHQDGT